MPPTEAVRMADEEAQTVTLNLLPVPLTIRLFSETKDKVWLDNHVVGDLNAGSFTTVFWSLRDTPVNRTLMAFYSPLRHVRGFDLPVEWY